VGAAEGIRWFPGDEDYPFPTRPGEDARAFVDRWLAEAPYARVVEDGVRYVNETDVVNLVNAVTSNAELMQVGLSQWGDRLLLAAERVQLIKAAREVASSAAHVADVLASDVSHVDPAPSD